jgi:hypothetical protein
MTAPCVFFPDPEARHLCSVWYDAFWNLFAHLLCSMRIRPPGGLQEENLAFCLLFLMMHTAKPLPEL